MTPAGRTPPGASARRLPFAVLVLALLVGGAGALLALTTATAASEVLQRGLDASNQSLTDTEQQLSREVAAQQAPDELARAALRLGLVPAGSPAFLRVNANGSVTVLGRPAAVTPPPQPVTPKPRPTPARPTATSKPKPKPSSSRPPAAKPTPKPTPKPAPKPARIPTPTVTLPGGPR